MTYELFLRNLRLLLDSTIYILKQKPQILGTQFGKVTSAIM